VAASDPSFPPPSGDDLAAAIEAAGPRDIAVVGMSGSFPKARDLDRFWANLRDGVEGVTFFSDAELRAAGVEEALLAHPDYVKAGSLLDGVEDFDAPFFGYSARDAEILDPQQRLFLEHSWAALENAGHSPGTYPGLIGVYAGVAWNTYLLTQLATHPELFARGGGFQVFISNDKDFMPTRASYKLNLKGPSLIVQTSCSTSLVAIHLASLSLLNYECDMALAGGVTVKVPQVEGYFYQEGGLASPDGHCRAFDARAAGTIFGSGVGVVVLKRLADALADGDRVRAVIRGSAVNNDGSVKVSYTAPSVFGQAEVVAAAQAVSGIDPATVQYVETHGTGTALGDPIEVAALTKVFAAATDRKGFCALGSVKSNIGHLDAAAGVAGFIKTVLALEHRQIPPSLHFESPNPTIDFAASPFHVAARLADWPAGADGPRRAGVSSFGVGGTNAHLILEEAPPPLATSASRPAQLLLLSARTLAALEESTARLADRLEADPALPLPDVAYTLAAGRTVFRHRRALVARDTAEAVGLLRGLDPARVLTVADSQEPRKRPVVFLFPGQGAQFPGMGEELYRKEAVFREEVDRCSELLLPHLGLDLRAALYPSGTGETGEAERRLEQTRLAQPALFTVEYALARLYLSWGIEPQALLGHSIGEWVAATLAGVFALPDALALVAARGRLMQEQPGGAMLAVPLAEAELLPLLGPRLGIAAVNEPQRTVVSGPVEAIEDLARLLAGRGIEGRRLHTSHAFHSAMMDPVLAPFAAEVRRVPRSAPSIPFLSNVSGTWIGVGEAEDPAYWTRQLRSPVRFASAVAELAADPERVLLEVGPGRNLATLARRQAERLTVLSSLRHPGEANVASTAGGDLEPVLAALGRLWLSGVEIDWRRFYAGERRQRVPLPTYPFERQRYWISAARRPETPSAAPAAPAPRKRPDLADWFYSPSWQRAASPPLPPLPPAPPPLAPGDLAADRRRRWLVLLDDAGDRGLGAGIAERLAAEGREVTTAVVGTGGLTRLGEGAYALEPARPESYGALLAELAASGGLPDAIVHAWSVGPAGEPAGDPAGERGFGSLVALARALGARGSGGSDGKIAPVELWVLSSGVHRVTGGESRVPARAALLGPCRVIPQELPGVACQALDVDLSTLPSTGRVDATLVGRVLRTIAAGPTGRFLADRDGRLWEQVFLPLRLTGEGYPRRELRPRGVYLLTGSLEGPGFGLARYLAQTVGARLLLVEGAPDSERQARQVGLLEAAGAEVLVATARGWEEAGIAAGIERALARWGTLDGAIHAAGAAGERTFLPLAETGPEEAAWHFVPKVHGLYALHRALAGRRLDFRVAVSSLASVLGGVGSAAYAAANLVVDAFVEDRGGDGEAAGTAWMGIQWDAWRQDDAAPGEVAIEVGGAALSASLAELAMTPAEGGEAFRRILAAAPFELVTISTGSLAERIGQARSRAESRGMAGTAAAAAVGGSLGGAELHARPVLPTPYVAPETELEQAIAEVWRRTLGFAQLGVNDNFFEIGGDSFLAVRLASELKQALAMEIPVAKLYQGLTIRALAALLAPVESPEERLAHHLAERRETMGRRKEFLESRRSGKRTV
jgi:phthiocerol/phenolphthiocerol synthesis type-I polyketide synthase E